MNLIKFLILSIIINKFYIKMIKQNKIRNNIKNNKFITINKKQITKLTIIKNNIILLLMSILIRKIG